MSFGAATTLSAGGNKHACVSTASGVKCWGRNDAGELGTGAKSGFSNVPLDATAFTSASLVSVGDQHTCVLTGAGGVECVGFNGFGGLGNGTKVDSLMAVKVVGLSAGAISVSAGDAFTCAVNSTGGAQCWGRGINGQLGNGSFADSSSPVDVQGLTSGVASVSAHFAFACALTTAGGAKCWGDGTFGKLGRGAAAPGATPADVVGLTSGVVSISTGNQHACAVTSTGGVKCWGYNGHGQLGNGAMPTNANAPVDVVGLTSGVVSVSAGEEHTCAVTTTGTVKCWGSNAKGQLGNGAIGGVSDVPVSVSGLTGVSKVVMGYYHSCALTTAGAVKCWGSNSYGGELGNNDTKDSAVPVSVLGLP